MRSMTEGEEALTSRHASSPSDAFGATSPWRGRIEVVGRAGLLQFFLPPPCGFFSPPICVAA